jgi:hypothetical protein
VPETAPYIGESPKWYLTSFLSISRFMVRRFSIFIVIGRFKNGVEVPVGSVPDVVNDIVPLNVAELPLKLRFKD